MNVEGFVIARSIMSWRRRYPRGAWVTWVRVSDSGASSLKKFRFVMESDSLRGWKRKETSDWISSSEFKVCGRVGGVDFFCRVRCVLKGREMGYGDWA